MENANLIESAAVPTSNMSLGGLLKVPAVRQIMLLIGVAAAVAAGFAIVLWSQSPGYTQLYGDMSASEAADVADALRAVNIDYKINASTGDILVPESSLHDARMQLASQGLPAGAAGMEIMKDQSSFGVSQFMETARYQHALEAELAETIATLGAVRDARVHLAIPKQSSFIRDQKTASASVLLTLFRGRTLEADQATAVVNLVAASVPNLKSENVTVVDQFGTLLSAAGQQVADAQATTQFKYTQRLEDTYKRRIEDLLTPLLGAGRVRAQVVADVDFTYVEETRESFDPARSVVRSEQVNEDLKLADEVASGGVPGALSNQPPEAAGVDAAETAAEEEKEIQNSSRSSTRNYEIDRTISHTRPQSGTIRRLSVAVLVDKNPVAPVEGEAEQQALTDADVERFTALVKEAVGFNESRGDSVVVMSEAFHRVEAVEEAEPPAIWEKPMVQDIAKQVLGAILVLAIAFGIVRPMLKNVVAAVPAQALTAEYVGTAGASGGLPVAAGGAAVPGGATAALAPPSYDEKVAAAKNISGHDPARVAQVVKQWVAGQES